MPSVPRPPRSFPTRRSGGWRALWLLVWLAVLGVQANLAVHSELAGHDDDEACELCAAAATGFAWLPALTPPILSGVTPAPPSPPKAASLSLPARPAWQARAPPLVS